MAIAPTVRANPSVQSLFGCELTFVDGVVQRRILQGGQARLRRREATNKVIRIQSISASHPRTHQPWTAPVLPGQLVR
ncbi:hypothetical protein [Nocardia gipuzkoensis]